MSEFIAPDQQFGGTASERPWAKDRAGLKRWLLGFLLFWVGGLLLIFAGATFHSDRVTHIGFWSVLGSPIPYLGSLVHAYRVQSKLHAMELYKHGAWNVLVGGLILNPWILGVIIPASVFSTVRRIDRELDAAASQARHPEAAPASRVSPAT